MISIGGMNRLSAISVAAQNQASRLVDESTRKLATGSKVNNVKESGSNYVISNQLRNESANWEFRKDILRQMEPIFDLFADYNETGLTYLRDAQKILAFAANTAPNSSERKMYYDEWQILSTKTADLAKQRQTLYAFTGGSSGPGYAWTQTGGVNGEWSFSPFANLSYLNDAQIPAVGFDSSITSGVNSPGYTPTVFTVNQDFMGASQAIMAQAASEELSSSAGVNRLNNTTIPYTGGAQQTVTKMQDFASKYQNIIENAQSNMFDVDISLESAKLKAAQIKESLSANANYNLSQHIRSLVTNIMSNVLNTQRSVRA